MKIRWWSIVLVGLVLGLATPQPGGVVWSAEEPAPPVAKKEEAPPKPLYKPPLLGAPKARVGGGVRGAELADAPVVQVLAPDQPGATTREQPTLYFYLDRQTDRPVEVTVMEVGGTMPVVETKLSGVGPGLHGLTLSGPEQRLAVGKEYEWFVAVVLDPNQRSKDIIAGGGLLRVAPPAGLAERPTGGDYAAAGLWYDAVAVLVDGLKGGDKEEAKVQLQALLAQVGITGLTTLVVAP